MEHKGITNVVSWVNPGEHFKVDELSQQGMTLVELTDISKYGWPIAEVVGTLSILNIELAIDP